MKQHYIIYDCEIKLAIPVNGTRINGISYCQGWEDFAGMGISVICAYESKYERYRVFCKDNLMEFQKLANDPDALIIGYNSESFDDRLCAANGINVKTGYDLLREFYIAKGLNPYPAKYGPEYKGISLDNVAKVNLPIRKTGNGAYAPVLWQQGEYGQVIDYCLQDVHLTKCLLEYALWDRPLQCPMEKKPVWLRNPFGEKGSGKEAE